MTMITPSFSLTATERVLPRLALDFTTASLDPRVTFTRTGNTATVVNSSGFVAPVNADLPRFDYNPMTLACKGLLIEEARTNSATYSEDFLNTATAGSTRPWTWVAASVSINPSGAPATPANTLVANKLIENTAASTTHSIQYGFGLSSGAYTFSVYAKAAERSWIRLTNNTATGSNGSAYFNLSNGTVGTVGGGTASIQPAGNGWYRCAVSGTLTVLNTIAVFLATGDNGQAYTGDGSSGVYLWGAQFEAGAFATSYIPTELLAVTRNADLASMTGTNFSSWFNADEGSFVVGSSTSATGLRGVLGLGEFANDHYIAYSGSDAIYSITTNNIAQTFLTRSKTDKLASAYKTNVARLASGGSAVATDATVTLPTVSLLRIGNFWGVPQYYLNGHIKTINYYPQALIVNEVQAFSK